LVLPILPVLVVPLALLALLVLLALQVLLIPLALVVPLAPLKVFMLALEPIVHCWQLVADRLFDAECDEVEAILVVLV